jgi:hypothetical protein
MHAELPRSQFSGQFRVGRVSSVDAQHHRAQVQFFEIDGFVSWDLQVLVTRPGDYSLPAKDAAVLCVIVDGRLGVGYVLGAIYTDNDAAPLSDAGQRAVAGDDLRLGDPAASKKVALAPTCKQNFDDIQTEFNTIKTTLASLTGGATVAASFTVPYTTVAYSPTDPAAAKVSAK